jgi:hypothetical protein
MPEPRTSQQLQPVPDKSRVLFEYKVLTLKDRWFSGKFSPDVVEKALNELAREGWRVAVTLADDIPGQNRSRNAALIVMERRRA